ncbi:MAG: hypothetical protein V4710_23295 [Verrucomicrobiota bacterium]
MTLTIGDEELDKAVERLVERRPPPRLEELSMVEMKRSRNKEEAAWFLGCTTRQIEIWSRPNGDRGGLGLPFFKPAHCVWFTYETLEAWRAEHLVK